MISTKTSWWREIALQDMQKPVRVLFRAVINGFIVLTSVFRLRLRLRRVEPQHVLTSHACGVRLLHDVHISSVLVASSPLPVTDNANHKLTSQGVINHFLSNTWQCDSSKIHNFDYHRFLAITRCRSFWKQTKSSVTPPLLTLSQKGMRKELVFTLSQTTVIHEIQHTNHSKCRTGGCNRVGEEFNPKVFENVWGHTFLLFRFDKREIRLSNINTVNKHE